MKRKSDSYLIQEFLEGELHGEALKNIKCRIQNDPEFASEVKLHIDIDVFLKEYLPLYEQLEKVYQKVILKKK